MRAMRNAPPVVEQPVANPTANPAISGICSADLIVLIISFLLTVMLARGKLGCVVNEQPPVVILNNASDLMSALVKHRDEPALVAIVRRLYNDSLPLRGRGDFEQFFVRHSPSRSIC